MNRLTFFICIFFVLSGCKKDQQQEEANNIDYREMHNISYGSDDEQIYDAYLPAGRSATTKVILMIHGGGWTMGDKRDNNLFIDYFISKGYAVINPNYRLVKATQDKFPTQIDDIRKLLDTVLSKKNDYIISDKIGIMGVSAGAHLSLLYAYAYNQDKHIKAVASISGPTDFVEVAGSSNTALITDITYTLGSPYDTNAQLWKNASPYWKVATGAVPTLLFAGGKDTVVDPVQSQLLAEKLNTLGVVNKQIVYPNEGHIWASPLNFLDTEQQIDNWFSRYIN